MSSIDTIKTRVPLSDQGREQLDKYYNKAQLIGPYTVQYIIAIIEVSRMEQQILDGCKALLSLQLAYNNQRMEAACRRGLKGTKYNYNAIKNILVNNLDQVPLPPSQGPSDHEVESKKYNSHCNLRGPSFFKL